MDFQRYFQSRQGEMIRLLKDLVSRESPSSEKKAVDACSAFLIGEFKKTGTKITRFPQKKTGDMYLVEFPQKSLSDESGQILLLTHLDTVWPVGKMEKMPFYLSGNKIFGPGALDMKAGIVMAVYALKTLHELNLKPRKKIAVFINSAEEIGSDVSYDIIRKLAKKSEGVLCLEPSLPGGALKTQRKGRLVICLKTRGRAAHAGSPEKGVNAIEELIHHLGRIKRLRMRGTTVNFGLIGGGEKANIVAEHAWSTLDFRFWKNPDKERIITFFKELKPCLTGAQVKFAVESLTPPMEKNEASAKLLARIRSIASTMNITLKQGKTGGGSDASIVSSMGIATVDGLGPDGDGIHAENEHVLLPSMIARTALLTELLHKL